MKRIICAALTTALLLTGCASAPTVRTKRFQATFLTLFDTVTTIVGMAESEEAFTEAAQSVHDELLAP